MSHTGTATRDPAGDGGERTLTAAEFAKLPEEGRYVAELVRGRLVRSPRPATYHGLLVARLARVLSEFVEANDYGVVVAEGGTLLARDPDTVRGPDVAFYSHTRVPEHAYATTFWGPPDLAIEIVSPSNTEAAMREKIADYLEAGVRVVWVVDPATRGATSYRPGTARGAGAAAAGGELGGPEPGGQEPGGPEPGWPEPSGPIPTGPKSSAPEPGGPVPGRSEPGTREPGRSKAGGPKPGGSKPRGADPRRPLRGPPEPGRWSVEALKPMDALACDDVLPGFRLPLAAVFGL
ncbi:MAG TPA: Uma2 family endonuclease [Longimicrobiales bacterium]